MSLETIRSPPPPESFTPLSSYQSQTPQSFFNEKPILHHEIEHTTLIVPRSQITSIPLFEESPDSVNGTSTNGHGDIHENSNSAEADTRLDDIHVWVTSQRLILFNPTNTTGLSIPYPSITLHAISRITQPATTTSDSSPPQAQQGLYMQISKLSPSGSNGNDDEGLYDEDAVLELTLLPPPPAAATPVLLTPSSTSSQADEASSPIQTLFAALSACANLHPDPRGGENNDDDNDEEDDDNDTDRIVFEGSVGYESGLVAPGNNSGDGGLPPPFPGSGGWITAENVGEYFDAEGNWIRPDASSTSAGTANTAAGHGGLGPGAGRVRARPSDEEASGDDGDNNNQLEAATTEVASAGGGAGAEETKWRRTD
ncbi:MAG: hypothetical protein M1825_001787 [Sarcosagium campestre]|nr:MAG: hypothetical protein M1825_001787 [Sarcosagium campestre]